MAFTGDHAASPPTAMNALPTPRRLLRALLPQPAPQPPHIEPVLDLRPPPAPPSSPRAGRRAVETALEAGSRRVYEPMQETEILEPQRR
jgi:hypothetical protein